MDEVRCNGEKCKGCPNCKKSIDHLLNDVSSVKWRFGLLVLSIGVLILSLAGDVITIVTMSKFLG